MYNEWVKTRIAQNFREIDFNCWSFTVMIFKLSWKSKFSSNQLTNREWNDHSVVISEIAPHFIFSSNWYAVQLFSERFNLTEFLQKKRGGNSQITTELCDISSSKWVLKMRKFDFTEKFLYFYSLSLQNNVTCFHGKSSNLMWYSL